MREEKWKKKEDTKNEKKIFLLLNSQVESIPFWSAPFQNSSFTSRPKGVMRKRLVYDWLREGSFRRYLNDHQWGMTSTTI